MEHTQSAAKVYETKDYKLFKMITGNRKINDKKIKRIIKEIDNGNDMLQYCPIHVKEGIDTLNILDGQHRFTISRFLRRPVYYMIVKESKTMTDIAKVNSNVEKWKADDYINCYQQQGNKDYSILKDFRQKYGFSVGICLNLLASGEPGKSSGDHAGLHKQFETGDFEVKVLQKATTVADVVNSFDFFANWRSRDFIIAMYKIFTADKVPFHEIVAAVKKNQNMLTQQANHKDYIIKIEQIMNIGKSKRIILV